MFISTINVYNLQDKTGEMLTFFPPRVYDFNEVSLLYIQLRKPKPGDPIYYGFTGAWDASPSAIEEKYSPGMKFILFIVFRAEPIRRMKLSSVSSERRIILMKKQVKISDPVCFLKK